MQTADGRRERLTREPQHSSRVERGLEDLARFPAANAVDRKARLVAFLQAAKGIASPVNPLSSKSLSGRSTRNTYQ